MPEDPTAKARRVWDALAPRYDRSMRFFDRVWFGGGRQWVCSRARGNVLEVAVGTGLNLPVYPADVRLTGVDLSPAMLAVARRRAADLGRDVDLQEGDAQALPFRDASFDTAVCTLSLCAVPDERVAIGQMWRVLRPGGRLLLLDHVGSNWWPIWAGQRLLERFTARSGEYQTRRPLPLVKAAGFEVVETQRLKAGTVERVAARKPTG
ncbi:MAG TPA: class I SAM-dependent methyltransferase [Pilimelia sp.]|nr:class I SAM-dependent methyltransferase [Pilimelia sp.]